MIDIDIVKSLFGLFSGQDITENAHFLTLARAETERILLPDVPETDERVNFLCAAIANYRYQQAKSSGDRSTYTYAGEMMKADKYTPLAFAESMLKDYYQMCRDIIKPQNFVFMGFSSEEDLK